ERGRDGDEEGGGADVRDRLENPGRPLSPPLDRRIPRHEVLDDQRRHDDPCDDGPRAGSGRAYDAQDAPDQRPGHPEPVRDLPHPEVAERPVAQDPEQDDEPPGGEPGPPWRREHRRYDAGSQYKLGRGTATRRADGPSAGQRRSTATRTVLKALQLARLH